MKQPQVNIDKYHLLRNNTTVQEIQISRLYQKWLFYPFLETLCMIFVHVFK